MSIPIQCDNSTLINIVLIFSKTNAVIVPDDEFGEKSVSVLLDGEESELIFIDHPSTEMSVSLQAGLVKSKID